LKNHATDKYDFSPSITFSDADQIMSDLIVPAERSCTDCEDIKESYEKLLDEEQKQLINFRGHGRVNHWQPAFEPFTRDEIEQMIKLAILGAKAFHFSVVKSESLVDVSLDGVRIKCQIKEDEEMLVKLNFEAKNGFRSSALFDITHPFDCDLSVYLSSNGCQLADNKKFIRKDNERGNQSFSFIVNLETKPEILYWNIQFRHH